MILTTKEARESKEVILSNPEKLAGFVKFIKDNLTIWSDPGYTELTEYGRRITVLGDKRLEAVKKSAPREYSLIFGFDFYTNFFTEPRLFLPDVACIIPWMEVYLAEWEAQLRKVKNSGESKQ